METYHVHYEHTSSNGAVTTGFNSISASSQSEARDKFYDSHDNSYRVTRIEKQ